MKTINLSRTLIMLAMLCGALSVARADNKFYAGVVNFEPGECKDVALMLDNTQPFYGFQADITLPEGLEFVMTGGKADFTLTQRADKSYMTVSNLLSERCLRIGAFSLEHSAIAGDEGALCYVTINATDSFAGGVMTLSDILFVDAADNDVALPEYLAEVGTRHDDAFYMPDFMINVGAVEEVSLILKNETTFTAFQTDIYLPPGLSVVDNSWATGGRCANHTVSAKSFADGRVRLVCFSADNTPIAGNDGAVLTLQIEADNEAAGSCEISMRNQRFTTPGALEYVVDDTTTAVTVEGVTTTGISSTVYDDAIVTASEGVISVSNVKADETVTLYDLTGRCLNRQTTVGAETLISAVRGEVFIVVVSGDRQIVRKVIVP